MSEKWYVSQGDIFTRCEAMVGVYMQQPHHQGNHCVIYGVPRGGIPVAYLFSAILRLWYPDITPAITTEASNADVIVDDLIDSGTTQARYMKENPDIPFVALFDKRIDPLIANKWIVFPWEGNEQSDSSADDIPLRLLEFIGEDPNRGGLKDTPKRFLKAWQAYTSGYGKDPAEVLKTFEDGAENYDEMVLVKDIPIYSHCEHHLAPFFGTAHVAYIPNGRVVGLSKIPRVVDIFMRRLQVQERLTKQIAEAIDTHLKPKGVAVVMNCRHFCMECRGVELQGVSTTTSKMTGVFMENLAAREEFMGLIK